MEQGSIYKEQRLWGPQILVPLFGPLSELQSPGLRNGNNNTSLEKLGGSSDRRRVPITRASLDQSMLDTCSVWLTRVPEDAPSFLGVSGQQELQLPACPALAESRREL